MNSGSLNFLGPKERAGRRGSSNDPISQLSDLVLENSNVNKMYTAADATTPYSTSDKRPFATVCSGSNVITEFHLIQRIGHCPSEPLVSRIMAIGRASSVHRNVHFKHHRHAFSKWHLSRTSNSVPIQG